MSLTRLFEEALWQKLTIESKAFSRRWEKIQDGERLDRDWCLPFVGGKAIRCYVTTLLWPLLPLSFYERGQRTRANHLSQRWFSSSAGPLASNTHVEFGTGWSFCMWARHRQWHENFSLPGLLQFSQKGLKGESREPRAAGSLELEFQLQAGTETWSPRCFFLFTG